MMRFHFKETGRVTASAVLRRVWVCVCVFELSVCDLSGILINLVNEHHADLCVCVICLRVTAVAWGLQLDTHTQSWLNNGYSNF